MSQHLRVAALTVWASLASPPALADFLVIASDVQSLAAGQVVSGDRHLSLVAGTTVTLLDPAGSVVSLTGPYDGVPSGTADDAAGGERLFGALARLVEERSAQRSRLAAFRGAGAASAGRPDVWGIDVRRGQRFCVAHGVPPTFWRSGRKPRRKITLSDDRGLRADLEWPAGKATLDWPARIPVRDGGRYAFGTRGGAGEAFSVHLMPAQPNDAHRAAWMEQAGCSHQAGRVVDMLSGR